MKKKGTATLENNFGISYKIKQFLTYSNNSTLGIDAKESETSVYTKPVR